MCGGPRFLSPEVTASPVDFRQEYTGRPSPRPRGAVEHSERSVPQAEPCLPLLPGKKKSRRRPPRQRSTALRLAAVTPTEAPGSPSPGSLPQFYRPLSKVCLRVPHSPHRHHRCLLGALTALAHAAGRACSLPPAPRACSHVFHTEERWELLRI